MSLALQVFEGPESVWRILQNAQIAKTIPKSGVCLGLHNDVPRADGLRIHVYTGYFECPEARRNRKDGELNHCCAVPKLNSLLFQQITKPVHRF